MTKKIKKIKKNFVIKKKAVPLHKINYHLKKKIMRNFTLLLIAAFMCSWSFGQKLTKQDNARISSDIKIENANDVKDAGWHGYSTVGTSFVPIPQGHSYYMIATEFVTVGRIEKIKFFHYAGSIGSQTTTCTSYTIGIYVNPTLSGPGAAYELYAPISTTTATYSQPVTPTTNGALCEVTLNTAFTITAGTEVWVGITCNNGLGCALLSPAGNPTSTENADKYMMDYNFTATDLQGTGLSAGIYLVDTWWSATDCRALGISVYIDDNVNDPYILPNPSSLNFYGSQTKTSTISSGNLTGNINISVTGPYEVSTNGTTFATTASMPANGGTLHVKYTSTSTTAETGVVTLSSTGAPNATITLSGVGEQITDIITFFTEDSSPESGEVTEPIVHDYSTLLSLYPWVANVGENATNAPTVVTITINGLQVNSLSIPSIDVSAGYLIYTNATTQAFEIPVTALEVLPASFEVCINANYPGNSEMALEYCNTCVTIEKLIIGINEESISTFRVYPNPSKGEVNVRVVENSTINVYDVTGKLINTGKANAGETYTFTQTTTGMYFVNVNGKVQKIVIE